MGYSLVVFEGERTENLYFDSLCASGLMGSDNPNMRRIAIYGTDIYQLSRKFAEDDDLVLLNLLKERSGNDSLAGIKAIEIAEAFLFFDYDGHATKANDEAISELLDLFNNETDHGQLYISYPMVEALRHIPKDATKFSSLCAKARINELYKKRVHDEGDSTFQDIKGLSREQWLELIDLHVAKAKALVDEDGVNSNSIPRQENVFEKQKKHYIDTEEKVVLVLSAFPLFYAENYPQYLRQLLEV